MREALLSTNLTRFPLRRGKVRDIYDLGPNLLIVATDRISAFDVVMPNGIPDKGIILTGLSRFWFDHVAEITPHHVITTQVEDIEPLTPEEQAALRGRVTLARKADVIPIECVVRGYLAGSGWKEYLKTGSVSDVRLPRGLKEASRLPEPIFTPATKASSGHDENISLEDVTRRLGHDLTHYLAEKSLEIYSRASSYALEKGIIVSDTKFEWGFHEGEVILIDELLTPDSSRFWPADSYREGTSPLSFDKQFVRDYLESCGWKKDPPAPKLPREIVEKTRQKYIEAYRRLVGEEPALS